MSEQDTRGMLPVADGRTVAARVWRMLAGRRLALCGIVVLFLLEAGLALVFPLVIGSLVDTVRAADGSGVPASFWWQVALLPATAVAAGLLAWMATRALARLAETVVAELREGYVAAALDLPRATIETAGTGDVVTRASDDIAQISGTLPDVLPRLSVAALTMVLVAGGLAALNPWFLAGYALTIPLYGLTVRWYLRTAPGVYVAERTAESARGHDILGTLTQLPTVTAHRLEHRQLERIKVTSWQTVRWAMRTRIVQNRMYGHLNVTELLGLLLVLGIGVWLALLGEASAGQVTAAVLLFLRTVAPIAELLFLMDELQSALASLGRIIGVTATRGATATDAPDTRSDAGPAVEVAGVHFAYRPDRPVLTAIDTRIDDRSVLAVVGATGSGKSTLASLIAGVYRPTTGDIVRRVDPQRIVTVTQETHVFAGTVRDNLTLAAPGATDEQITTALKQVGAEHIVELLPDGLDTEVGDGGHAVTAAQAQHLALARLALADPALVILDEATAEADTADTAVLDRATTAVTSGRSALVIAHRLSQARTADRIVVLQDGRLVETGTHDDLIAAGGRYADLWTAWETGRR
ncbi:ABC transporter ATP-binding protein [Micromonospora craniellae]|uniref:ABC transporter ATP-binding protein n=1 Tax=Micromonospora craniellae TaxID=2294034 RepID=A0A372FRZ5_9ACTN|nr:ABC transporter ATP-binding protein [Micromonospora craniellae]QOC94753.1 ABC transporter ATP-binding protein [Micromonospora craniellae]RFS43557.1 ABC transporter ATP-binding protein [Micromonospora craniellae]